MDIGILSKIKPIRREKNLQEFIALLMLNAFVSCIGILLVPHNYYLVFFIVLFLINILGWFISMIAYSNATEGVRNLVATIPEWETYSQICSLINIDVYSLSEDIYDAHAKGIGTKSIFKFLKENKSNHEELLDKLKKLKISYLSKDEKDYKIEVITKAFKQSHEHLVQLFQEDTEKDLQEKYSDFCEEVGGLFKSKNNKA